MYREVMHSPAFWKMCATKRKTFFRKFYREELGGIRLLPRIGVSPID